MRKGTRLMAFAAILIGAALGYLAGLICRNQHAISPLNHILCLAQFACGAVRHGIGWHKLWLFR